MKTVKSADARLPKNSAADTESRRIAAERRIRKKQIAKERRAHAVKLAEENAEIKKRAAAERAQQIKKIKFERKAAELVRKRQRELEREEIRKARAKLAAERLKRRKAVYAKLRRKLGNRREGFGYVNSGILPRTELVIGGDRTSAVTRLSSAGITVSDVRVTEGKTVVKIRKKDLRKAIAILDEMCYTHSVGATFGIGRFLLFWAARAGLLLGAAVSVAVLNVLYGYVWQIRISGNELQSAASIESALKRAGVSVGCKKSEPLAERVAKALDGMSGIADASCEIRGTTLYVRVLESKDFEIRQKYYSYRSEYDATVTRIVMRSGTASVKSGDVVKRGDVLADGNVYSTAGELLYSGECDADIYGNVSITFTADVSVAAVEYKRTGRSKNRTVFELFGCKMGSAAPPYKSYEMSSHTANYDVLLPLYVTTYRFYETKAVEYERDVKEVAEDYARSKIDELGFAGDFEYSYNVKPKVAGLYTVHLFLSGETLISRGVSERSAT